MVRPAFTIGTYREHMHIEAETSLYGDMEAKGIN